MVRKYLFLYFCSGQDYDHYNCCRYVETAVYTGHTKDVREQKQAQLKAKKDAEKAIIKLSEREHTAGLQRAENAYASLFLAPPEPGQPLDSRYSTNPLSAAQSPELGPETVCRMKHNFMIGIILIAYFVLMAHCTFEVCHNQKSSCCRPQKALQKRSLSRPM